MLAVELGETDSTDAGSVRASPGTTAIGSLVQVGTPARTALSPLPSVVAAFEPSVPWSLQVASPAAVSSSVQPSGPVPSLFGWLKSPLVTLLPLTDTSRVETLFDSLISTTVSPAS